jgi:hypothetical protein
MSTLQAVRPQDLFYLGDIEGLRAKLARAQTDGSLMGQVWGLVRRRAADPVASPWFLPFVAVITQEPATIAAARDALRRYVATMNAQQFGMGLQFHFWCFAFPHARWALYFHWLDQLGAWDDETERRSLRDALIGWQFVNFYYGMRTKPEPQCVDNQTMALCFSNALVGELFGSGPGASAVAAVMRRDGLRRLPSMLGGFPPSGYSGEGSTYMDHVVGPSIPFAVELLERVHGGEWFTRTLEPNGGSAQAVVRMIAREWTPCGLTLPWDHYGYQLPVRSCIAYGAHKTGDDLYLNLLEQHACFGHDYQVGWGYDDLVWSLIWWPAPRPRARAAVYQSWAEPTVGAALVSPDASLYLMQMWDESTPNFPGRAHVNPNSLILVAHGSPLTTDGVPDKTCTAFRYDDTWIERDGQDFGMRRDNFGPGCGGAHSVLLVDEWEGMRARSEYEQARLVSFDAAAQSVTADVTPLYRERWADARIVRRRSRLCQDRFWLIEDLALFDKEHDLAARWFLRPGQVPSSRGVCIETAEGVRLQLLPLLGPDTHRVRTVEGYPNKLEGASLQVDFLQRGSCCRWLWLAWPTLTRREIADVSGDWQCVSDADSVLTAATARAACDRSGVRLPMTMPAFMAADQPLVPRWWYRKTVTAPAAGPLWLRLPRLMWDLRLWVNDMEIDLASHRSRMDLMEIDVELPPVRAGEAVELLVRVDCGIRQYGDDRHGSGFWGRPALLAATALEQADYADYERGVVSVRSGRLIWQIEHTLMTRE